MTRLAPDVRPRAAALLLLGACGSALDLGTDPPIVDGAPPPDRAAPCDEFFPCPAPGPATFSLCGHVFSAGATARLAGVPLFARLDDPDAPAAPLAQAELDACARFAAIDVPLPAGGSVVVSIDDPPNADVDDFVPSDHPFDVAPGALLADRTLLAVSRADDAAWGSPASRGAALVLFLADGSPLAPLPGAPTPGVSVVIDGQVAAERDGYFADPSPLARAELDPAAAATGANGSALAIEVAADVTGRDATCVWPVRPSETATGRIVVQLVRGACE